MWFKQIQLFQLTSTIDLSPKNIEQKLEALAFRPCLPSMESSQGWITPLETNDENAPLVRAINGYIMICVQVEEKILPATVIRHELAKKVKKIETEEDRKVRQSEKLSLKDELKITLLPRAFSKFTKVYAYIDTKQRQVILGSAQPKKAEQFLSLFKKSLTPDISALDINKLSPIITRWLKQQDYPASLAIEKSCLLQDPNQESRSIRCQQQDLFTPGIQSLLNDGCAVKQLALNWQDRLSFVLADDCTFKSIKFQDEIIAQANEMEPETREQQFDADFLIMTDIFTLMLADLLTVFAAKKTAEPVKSVAAKQRMVEDVYS